MDPLKVHLPDGAYRSVALFAETTASDIVENVFSKVNPAGEAREYGLLEITADAYRLLDDDTKPAAIRAAWGDSPPEVNRFMFRLKEVAAPSPKEGFLTKRGHFVKNWKRRWFRMADGMVLYFRARSERRPAGCVSLTGATVRVADKFNKDHCFQIVTEDGEVLVTYAETEAEQIGWMEAIQDWISYLHILRSKRHAARRGTERTRRNSAEILAAVEAGVSYTPPSDTPIATAMTGSSGDANTADTTSFGGSSFASSAGSRGSRDVSEADVFGEADDYVEERTLTDADVLGGEIEEAYTSKMKITDFELLTVLGKGSFGKVFLARLKGEEKLYAVKVLKKMMVLESEELEHTRTERAILKDMRHPFLVRMYFSFQSPDRLYFVMDYVNGGELFYHMTRTGQFDEGRAAYYGAEMSLAISFLHSHGIVYRDLKLENLLLDNEGHILLTDFGLCKMGVGEDVTTSSFCGTPEYLAPEVVEEEDYGTTIDWWSLGIVLYEMMTGRSPFNAKDHDELFLQILTHPIYYPPALSDAASDALHGFLTRDPDERLGVGATGIDDIGAHPFFSHLDFALLEAREIPPPYVPELRDEADTTHFDPVFTSEAPQLSPPDESELLTDEDQRAFLKFTFVAPETKLKIPE